MALSTHTHTTGHIFDFKSVTISDKEKHIQKRFISDMLHIKSFKNKCVNKKTDVNELNSTYFKLL